MSEANQQEVVGQNPEGEKQAPNSIEERLNQLESTNKRLLNESKEWQKKYQLVKEDVDKKEKETLSAKEDWKGLLEKEKKTREELASKLNSMKNKTIHKALEFEIAKYAPDAQDFDLLKKAIPVDVISAVEQDDDILLEGVKEAIEKLKSEKPFMFKPKQIPGMAQGKPVHEAKQNGAKDLSKLSPAELASLLITRKV